MSRQLLKDLNGNNSGQLKNFLDTFEGEPRIAWYPSAGVDFRPLLYLHPNYSKQHPPTAKEPNPPDIFLFTDYFPWKGSTFLHHNNIYSDKKTSVDIEHIEELPRLNLPLHSELIHFPEGSTLTNRSVFLKIRITSNTLGDITFPVIYCFAVNETFYCNKMIPNQARMAHIIHVRYGGGLGGGTASGVWLLHVLKILNCEVFITDNHYHWQSGDRYALRFCPSIPRDSDAHLIPIRVVKSLFWSRHGNVSWNLVE
jgi:hypothetical protein